MSSSEISSSLSKNSGSLGNPSSSLVKNSMNLHGGTNNKSVTKPSNHSSKGHLPQTGELTSIVAATIGVILIAVGVYSVKKMK